MAKNPLGEVDRRISGRPEEYKPEYCESIKQYLAGGLTADGWYAENGVAESTAWEWRKKYPDFAKAYKDGRALAKRDWQKLGRSITGGKVPKANVVAYIFLAKALYGIRDDAVEENTEENLDIPESMK